MRLIPEFKHALKSFPAFPKPGKMVPVDDACQSHLTFDDERKTLSVDYCIQDDPGLYDLKASEESGQLSITLGGGA